MLQSNECPLGESLRGMPMANVAMQRMPAGRISSRNASRMLETILDSLCETLEYSFPILLRLIVLMIQLYKNDSLLFFEMRVDQSKTRIYSFSL